MAKRSFASQLARGFVRSAVNQVGRDGGRVISNRIYNGQNYIPVAGVDASAQFSAPTIENTPNPAATSTTTPLSVGKIILLTLLSVLIIPIGSIGVLIYGISSYFRKTDKIVWYEDEHQHTSDRRYKTGVRYTGTIKVKKHARIPATEESMAIHKRNGIIAITIGIVGLIVAVVVVLVK